MCLFLFKPWQQNCSIFEELRFFGIRFYQVKIYYKKIVELSVSSETFRDLQKTSKTLSKTIALSLHGGSVFHGCPITNYNTTIWLSWLNAIIAISEPKIYHFST